MAFDGERLAVSRTLGYTNFILGVYDASGLIYYGEYYNSLSADNDTAHAYADTGMPYYIHYDNMPDACMAVFEDPIQLEWNE